MLQKNKSSPLRVRLKTVKDCLAGKTIGIVTDLSAD